MTLRDLRPDMHHRGHVIWLSKVFDHTVVKPAYIALDMFDDSAGTFVLQLPWADPILANDAVLARKRIALAVKDPFCSRNVDGRAVIRVEDLSDMVVTFLPDFRAPDSFNSPAMDKRLQTASELKVEGNALLNDGNTYEAMMRYGEGLHVVGEQATNLQKDLHRNRALTHLRLGHYNLAKADAVAPLTFRDDDRSKRRDGRAFYRVASACYSLGQYDQAIKHLQGDVLPRIPGDTKATELRHRASVRLLEQQTGGYDFATLLKELGPETPYIDVAGHTKKTEIKFNGALGGRGLFAVQEIALGGLVMCEKAFFLAFDQGDRTGVVETYDPTSGVKSIDNFDLSRGIANKLVNNPSLCPQVLGLHAARAASSKDLLTVDGQPVIDNFRLADIEANDKYGVAVPKKDASEKRFGFWEVESGDGGGEDRSARLWRHCSLINHSCLPNTNRVFVGDLILFRACKPIAAGEEITTAYVLFDCLQRQEMFPDVWGFTCKRALCIAEERDNEAAAKIVLANLDRRTEYLDEDLENPRTAYNATQATYNQTSYIGVPRLAAIGAFVDLIDAHFPRVEIEEATMELRRLFLAGGLHDVSFNFEEMVLRACRNVLFVDPSPILILLAVAKGKESRGQAEKARALRELARILHVIFNGVDAGFDEGQDAESSDELEEATTALSEWQA